jgi:hypothetical protein
MYPEYFHDFVAQVIDDFYRYSTGLRRIKGP